MQAPTTTIIDAPLTLILGGSGIVTNNMANKGGQYFDYGLPPLHSSWIMQDANHESLTLFDTHFHPVPATALLSVLHIKAANALVMDNCE